MAVVPSAAQAVVQPITIPSQANIFGAGHASPPNPGGGGPGVLPPVVSLPAGNQRIVEFPALTGSVFAACSGAVFNGPDGSCNSLGTNITSFGGIAGLVSSSNMMLVGVFVGPAEPTDPAPARLDFRPTALGESFSDLAPATRQVFFIGDGKTPAGAPQRFHAPEDAIRLFVGIADAPNFNGSPCCWHDNRGEFTGTVQVTEASSPILPPTPTAVSPTAVSPPVLGKTVNVEPVKGQVFVSVPGGAARASASVPGLKGRKFVPLSQARQIPVGSLLDTRRGTVRLTSARDSKGTPQSSDFLSGVFQVKQSRAAGGLTELRMKGSSFRSCAARRRGKRSSVGAELSKSKRTIRRLRGTGSGRFRTRGRYSAATVRGTDWTVLDRCDGTLTKVTRGTVSVRDFRRRKSVTVRAGKSYFARARR